MGLKATLGSNTVTAISTLSGTLNGANTPKKGNVGYKNSGMSAYEVWLARGNTGTEEDFFMSLKGDPFTYEDFTQQQLDDLKGEKGDKGDIGLSAYEVWLQAGNTGSEEDFIESLRTMQPLSAEEVQAVLV